MNAVVAVHSQKYLKKSLNFVGAEAPFFFCDVVRHNSRLDKFITICYNKYNKRKEMMKNEIKSSYCQRPHY